MRSRTVGVQTLIVFLAALALLRQGIAWVHQHSPAMNEQSLIIRAQGIEPAALFYTESAQGLAATRALRRRLAGENELPGPEN